ncbi:helix-turn-helix domain-containing protein [Conexibacter sp. JD483]|uniref:ArsR/SmtB family transcription factor n=1 Tax=unclassified Conexibacter TaxID=2627773 RepID=UPI00271BDADF|nr:MULTISPECIES: helix-turn-helix domain-containing protein [unclassified Conexibacter]MDO8186235.1 helix-turn-helix domain-containing protein [Conexibacter sp. CPCC 205706]MDO8199698.1 helix-turn-helix domain-containing protein [Conexibacter sp. CPCC 205762]MDR9368210.1 helix-turn-helix domain-containing protein [Conexibacter sp. JD483]
MPLSEPPDAVDARVVKALSHPTRVRILELLQERELASPVELAGELEIPLGTVSYHVRRLEQLGFIELATRTQRRGAIEHHYRARAALDMPRRRRTRRASPADRSTPEAIAARLLDDAHGALARGGFDAVEARAGARALTLDERGRRQLVTLLERWSRKLEQVEQASARRIDDGNGSSHARAREATAVALLFELDE